MQNLVDSDDLWLCNQVYRKKIVATIMTCRLILWRFLMAVIGTSVLSYAPQSLKLFVFIWEKCRSFADHTDMGTERTLALAHTTWDVIWLFGQYFWIGLDAYMQSRSVVSLTGATIEADYHVELHWKIVLIWSIYGHRFPMTYFSFCLQIGSCNCCF